MSVTSIGHFACIHSAAGAAAEDVPAAPCPCPRPRPCPCPGITVSWLVCKMLHLHLLCRALRTFHFLQRAIDLPFTLHRLMAAQTKVIRRQSRETVQIDRERKREQQVSVFCSQQCPTTTYPQQLKQPRQCLLLTLR